MRHLILSAALAVSLAGVSATALAAKYTVEDTDIGTLLDDPVARAVLDKYMPGFSTQDNIDMGRSMTLSTIQQYKPDMITDDALKNIDAALAKLPEKK